MLKLIDLIPPYYISNSRDMQILARTFEVILNYCKTNSDLVNAASKDINIDMKNLMDLNLITLGFKQSHEYNLEQLSALLTIFRKIIKNKGNIKAIELVVELLSETEDCDELSEVIQDPNEPYKLVISIPDKIKDLSLFNDLMSYVLPSGISIEIIHTLKTEYKAQTNINIQNESGIKVYSLNTNSNEESLVDSYVSTQIPDTEIISETVNTLYSNQILNIPTTENEMLALQDALNNDTKGDIEKRNYKKFNKV